MNAIVQEQLGRYVSAFDDFRKVGAGSDLPWLTKLREDAFAQFAETGFPTPNVEDWRFTSVAPIAKTKFRLAEQLRTQELLALRDQVESCRIPGAAARMVFVNGHFAPEFSSLSGLPPGVFAVNLATQIAENRDTLRLIWAAT